MIMCCRPLRGLVRFFNDAILGLAPQALCCRSLRELQCRLQPVCSAMRGGRWQDGCRCLRPANLLSRKADGRVTFRRVGPRRKSSAIRRRRSSLSRSNTYSPPHDTTPLSHETNWRDQQNSLARNCPAQPRESADERRRAPHLARPHEPSPDNASLHDRSLHQTSTRRFERPVVRNQANRSSLQKDRLGPCPENPLWFHLDLSRAHWPTPRLQPHVQSLRSRPHLPLQQQTVRWTTHVLETKDRAAILPYSLLDNPEQNTRENRSRP